MRFSHREIKSPQVQKFEAQLNNNGLYTSNIVPRFTKFYTYQNLSNTLPRPAESDIPPSNMPTPSCIATLRGRIGIESNKAATTEAPEDEEIPTLVRIAKVSLAIPQDRHTMVGQTPVERFSADSGPCSLELSTTAPGRSMCARKLYQVSCRKPSPFCV